MDIHLTVAAAPKKDPHKIGFSRLYGELTLSRLIANALDLTVSSQATSDALTLIVFNLIRACYHELTLRESDPDAQATEVRISRRSDHYVKTPRVYKYPFVSLQSMTGALDLMEQGGFLTQRKGFKSKSGFAKGVSGTISPAANFWSLLELFHGELVFVSHREKGKLVLHDNLKKIQKYALIGQTAEMQKNLTMINSANAAHTYSCEVPDRFGKHFARASLMKRQTLPVETLAYNRIFNDSSFHLGGRFYSSFSNQTLEQRCSLLIDGQPSLELDYSGFHVAILYHLEGLTLDVKPYLVPGILDCNRDAAKKCLLVVFNCRSKVVPLPASVACGKNLAAGY